MPNAGSVLLAGNFLTASGGARQVCEELALRLERAGWRVRTASSVRNKALRLADLMRSAWSWRKEYDVAQVDVFSGSAFRWAEAVCWTLRRARKPYVLTLHGGNLPKFARKNPDRVRKLLNSAAAVTAPSGYLVEAMRPFRDAIIGLPNGIDFDNYPFRRRGPVEPNLVWVRSFHEIYNPAMAVGVVARLAAEFPNLKLRMVGPDKDGSLERTRQAAVQAGVADRIEFVPGVPKSEVPAMIARGDIFLNTTNFDNTPVTVLEAMACGTCVVTTDPGGIPYLVSHETDGLVVPVRDEAAMAAAVRRLLADPELAGRISSAAHAKAAQADWSAVLPAWQKLLLSSVDPQMRPAGEALRFNV